MKRLVIALLVCIILASTSTSTEVDSVVSEPQTVVVSVDSTNLRFTPSTVTIDEGDTVHFFWGGQALPHNAVEVDETFDSGEPERDVDYSFTFEIGTAGEYDFFCEPHQSVGMEGTITVNPVENQSESVEPPVTEEENSPFAPIYLTLGAIACAGIILRRPN
ncbi:MAG: plastocyanin/azurin family copper-binding protein [Candidatus Thermoplasmatota archaeon]|nr:plastocyanin/azurin family copper-binding protein [Candidatus Thermoplasmatota archaeon]